MKQSAEIYLYSQLKVYYSYFKLFDIFVAYAISTVHIYTQTIHRTTQ